MRTRHHPAEQLASDEGSESYSGRRRDAITTAWVVLFVSFAVFLALLVVAFVGAKRYYDTASLPRTATLSLEQGIVLFRDAVTSTLISAHDKLELREGDELLVGQGARASISLIDGSRIQLYSGSQLKLTELRRSRFHDGFTRIAVGLEKGTARFEVYAPPTEENLFLAATPYGYALLTKGNFGLEVAENRTRVSSREGSAAVYGKSGVAELQAGEKVLLTKTELTGPLPAGDQLVANGDFSQGFARWDKLQQDEPGRPVEAGQRSLVTEKIGDRETIALRLSRVSRMATHGEIGLTQVINKDVSDYQSLRLLADVRVDEQSLSGGGYMGYEYPIMIRVRYRDAAGAQIDWSHGFFFKNPENRPIPNGEWVPQAQWVAYNGDLLEVKPKPAHLISVEVLAAGHSFDGMIANVGLVGK